jgi:hypothetical protein
MEPGWNNLDGNIFKQVLLYMRFVKMNIRTFGDCSIDFLSIKLSHCLDETLVSKHQFPNKWINVAQSYGSIASPLFYE